MRAAGLKGRAGWAGAAVGGWLRGVVPGALQEEEGDNKTDILTSHLCRFDVSGGCFSSALFFLYSVNSPPFPPPTTTTPLRHATRQDGGGRAAPPRAVGGWGGSARRGELWRSYRHCGGRGRPLRQRREWGGWGEEEASSEHPPFRSGERMRSWRFPPSPPVCSRAESVLNCCIYDSSQARVGRGVVLLSALPSRFFLSVRGIFGGGGGCLLGRRCPRDQERELQPTARRQKLGARRRGSDTLALQAHTERYCFLSASQARGRSRGGSFLAILGKETSRPKQNPQGGFC